MKPVVALEEQDYRANPLWVPVAALAFALVVFAAFALAREPNMVALAVSGAIALVAAGALAFVWRLQRGREEIRGVRLRLVSQPRLGQNLSAILPVPVALAKAGEVDARLALTEFHYGTDGQVLDEKQIWEGNASFAIHERPQGFEAQIEIPIPPELQPGDDPGWSSPAVTPRTRYRRWRLELRALPGDMPFKRTYAIAVKSAAALG